MTRTPILAALLATAFAAGPVLAADPAPAKPAAKSGTSAKTLISVNGKAVPQYRADTLMSAQVAQGQAPSDELRKTVLEELVRREIISQEAVKRGFEKKLDIQAQIELSRQGVLIGAYLNDYAKANPPTDEALKKEYDGIRSALGDKEYKARHILVEKEEDAKGLIEKLKKGEKFEDLAKQSKDPGSKDRGGDLGWANRANYVKPFSEAMVKLEKGKYTEAPVKSDFGWHVIMLDDVRELKAPPFDDIKPQLVQRLQQRTVEKHIMDLRAKAKVE